MTDPTKRTLRLLSLLQRRRYWSGPDLASRLGVSDRTLRRDIDRLRELGYTIESDRGVDGGYRLRSSTGEAALLLDSDEATALAAALHIAAAGSSDLAEASLGALTKVLSMLGPEQRHRADAVRTTTVLGSATRDIGPELSVLDTVAAACRDQVRLSFDYTAANNQPTSRYVEPCQLVALHTRWYLVAYDDSRADWRTFRVDRMRNLSPARNRFSPRKPPASDLYEYVRFNMSEPDSSIRVIIEIDAPGNAIRREYGTWAEVDDLGPNKCRLSIDSDSFRWPTHIVTNLSTDYKVISPPQFHRHLLTVAIRIGNAAPTT